MDNKIHLYASKEEQVLLLHLHFLDAIVDQCLSHNQTLRMDIDENGKNEQLEKIIKTNEEMIAKIAEELQSYLISDIMGFHALEMILK